MRSNRRFAHRDTTHDTPRDTPRTASSTGRRTVRCLLVAAMLSTVAAAEFPVAASGAVSGGRVPVGAITSLVQDGMGFHLRGWAFDPDTSAPVKVKVRVNGKGITAVKANHVRPDIATAHPSYGPNRGYDLQWTLAVGTYQVCAYAVNYPTTHNWLLSCHAVTITHDPAGSIPWITETPGFLRTTGWAVDPDAPTTARTVSILVDNKQVARGPADRNYPDMQHARPTAGSMHAFSFTFPISEGTHTICLKVANSGRGVNKIVQCATRVINFSPTGRITNLTQRPAGFSVAGYATDPDSPAPINVTVTADGTTLGTLSATDTGGTKSGYGFHGQYRLPGTKLAPGNHTICAVGQNVGKYGKSRAVQCITRAFNWNARVAVYGVTQKSPGATITGWTVDPDTTAPTKVVIVADGKQRATVTANGIGPSHSGHLFTATVALADGKHSVCAIAVNLGSGSGNSAPRCATITLAFEPYGGFDSVGRAKGSTNVVATGWAIDPDSTGPITVEVGVDGGAPVTGLANLARPDIAKKHPKTGTSHGYAVSVPATDGEHTVCVRAVNVLGGSGTTSLGCKIINAVHPKAPAAPQHVGAIAGYGGARIVWTAPTSDGGAPWSSYRVTAAPGGTAMTVGAGINTATLLGLKPNTRYSFSVVAINVAGPSTGGRSPAVTTEKEPPAQTSPAPISTSRYVRNVRGGTSTDLNAMRREGAADAKANPSGHGYLVVLDIGGQDESRQGVILTAGIRYVSYANMVKNLNAYVDGYASQQRPSAPLTIAIATNNDIDVYRASGVNFANKIIDPVRTHTARYPGITIAGSDDMEPGFRASYASTKAWLQGFLSATSAPFVFTGSADGCAWTTTNRACNNGWTMTGMFYLAGGASAIRIVNLPQVYNSTMAQQWRYISLTGVQGGHPKINFGGALTEYTACRQAQSCGSLTGGSAWRQMWAQLRAEPKLRPSSLPYSTDLRIDS